ncbi:MAG TPA: hypothetical protein VKB35_08375, partial [Ktedonobacteraceae bacterium]|nr:hypothetical protein [Ktedonobacteraceae bacterium]
MKKPTMQGDLLDDSLPALQELQQHPHWVLWRYEERDGKATKVPYSAATRKRAAADNPATWASYAKARTVLARFSDQYDGLGFVFERDTVPITGVDLDHCVNPDGSIDAWAQAILDQLASYAEYSPSSTGIHVYVQGTVSHGFHKKVPGAPHAQAAIEMYSTGRYFTVTGQHVPGTPETIEDGASALAALSDEFNPSKAKHHAPPTVSDLERKLLSLSDEELLAKARAAKNGEKFWALWNGDTSEYLSPSEADQALCTMLAFWTARDSRRIDHLFRHSKLYRPEKWDRNARAAETYGEGTIARAIALCDTVYNPRYQQAQLEREIERLLHKIAEQHAQRKQQQHPQTLTPKEVDLAHILNYLEQNEHGDAYFFAEVFDGQVCYDHSDEAWYLWGGHAWKRDLTNQTRLLVSGVLGTLYLKTAADLNTNQAQLEQDIATRSAHSVADKQLEALKEQNRALTTQRSELTKRANALRGAKRNTNVLSFVKPIMGVTADIWDTDPWLLAVPNGVIDLRTGTHRDGFPGDYMRTVCPTEWAGLATPCPRFEQFLQELFADRAEAERAELIAFLHRLFGYGITGITSEAIFPIFYGEQGRNGKDTLLGTLKAVLGPIVGAVSNDVFIARSRERAEGAATPHLCDLQGKRLVWGSELKPGERLNIAQIKLLS